MRHIGCRSRCLSMTVPSEYQADRENCCRRPGIQLPRCLITLLVLAQLAQHSQIQAVFHDSGGSDAASVYQRMETEVKQEQAKPYDSISCPGWLNDYIKFHRETKNTKAARYMAYVCATKGDDCYFGMGDRLRGIELMLRAAMASNRVLLVDIPHPILFTTFFWPAEIDWGMGNIKIPEDATWWMGEGRVARLQSNEALAEPNRFVAVQGHGEIHILPVVGAPNITWLGISSNCIFHALFRPSEKVEQTIKKLQTHLGVLPPTKFLAIHLRLGGLEGEFQRVYRYDPVEAVRHSLRCARALSKKWGGLISTFVIITDSMELKNLILEGALTNVTTTRIVPAYSAVDGSIAGFNDNILPIQEHINTVADMGVMAAATCLIADFGSGFSTHARLWGGHSLWNEDNPCFKSTLECIQEGGGGVGMETLRT